MATDQAQFKLRRSTLIAHEGAKLLDKNGIAKGLPIMAEKRGIGQVMDGADGHVSVRTNVYGLLTRPILIYRYDVAIMGHLLRGRIVEINKKISKDTLAVDRRLLCREIMLVFKQQYSDFLQLNENCIYYDLQSLFYSLLPLRIDPQQNEATFPIAGDAIDVQNFRAARFDVSIKRVAGKSEAVNLADFSNINNNVKEVDRSLEQFLNLATSQSVMFNKEDFISFSSSSIYHLNPQKYGFRETDSPFFKDNGTYLGIGLHKGVHPVEGPRGDATLGLVVSTKKTPFHSLESVLQKACRFVANANALFNNTLTNNEYSSLCEQLKGIVVETTYGARQQKITIHEISRESSVSKRFTIEEPQSRSVTVQDYYREKYDIALQYPNAPLIISSQKGHAFPMEVCVISDNQRVKVQAQTPKQLQEMIKFCAVPPSLHLEQNAYSMKALALAEDEGLKKAKISVVPTSLRMAARHLPPPQLEYKDASVAMVRKDSFTWNGQTYLVPAVCNNWAAYMFYGSARDIVNESDFRKFIERFLVETRRNGMNLSGPVDTRYCPCNETELETEFRLAAKHGCQFLLVVHPDEKHDFHPAIKYNERIFGMVTQIINMSTVKNVVTKGQPLTLQNIINKTNVKMGGINYSLSFRNDTMSKEVLGTKTLYIGFGMNHPPPAEQITNGLPPNGNGSGSNGKGSNDSNGNGSNGSDLIGPNAIPSVVGYAANIGINDNFEFVGDFIYQEPKRDEKMSVITIIIARCVEAYRKNRRAEPERVVIYRNGCTDGQFGGILQYEIPLVRHELTKQGCPAGISLIVSNKRQNIRFFKDEINPHAKPPDQNIRPGTVVDSCVVHPKFCEFYLNSHRALQGTARTPRYTLLYDENKYTMDQLQGITNYLCYGHQIVNLPTSLPSPVYIAICYAERGQMLYKKMRGMLSSDSEPKTYKDLTARLGFHTVEGFRSRRINA